LLKTFSPSLLLMPSMWSGWKCEIRMVSIMPGSIPAAAMFANMEPAVSATWPAVPVSIMTSFDPVLTSSTVNEIGRMFGGRKAAASARLTALLSALRMNSSSILTRHTPS
jgi:hypothetical protein